VITDGIREYMARDWKLLEDSKRIDDPERALDIADELRVWGHEIHPEWPGPDELADDLATCIRVSESLRRASPRR
jgi:hypothetical protein